MVFAMNLREINIVIVTYNSEHVIEACLASLERVGVPAERVVVVDNGSRDNTVNNIRRRFSAVNVLEAAKNNGFAAACNLGSAEGREPMIVFLNPDTEVLETALETMGAAISAGAAAVGPLLIDYGGRIRPESTLPSPRIGGLLLQYSGLWKVKHALTRRYLLRKQDHAYRRPVLSGACLGVKRRVFEAVGGFDERFFMYNEDYDLCTRLARYGRLELLAGARVIHKGGPSSSGSQSVLLRALIARDQLNVKQATGVVLTARRLIIIGGLAVRWGLARSAGISSQDKREAARWYAGALEMMIKVMGRAERPLHCATAVASTHGDDVENSEKQY